MTKITTLFLDIGGVLLTNGWDRSGRKAAAEKFHLDQTEMDERHHLTFDTYEVGKMSLDNYLKEIVFYKPRSFTLETFKQFMFSLSQPYQEMIDYISEVKKNHPVKIAVVSNEGMALTEYRIAHFELKEFVDFFIVSCFVHFRKPDLDIYRVALDIAQVAPEEVAYIEDRSLFVEVAKGLGIHGIRHTSVAETKTELDKLLLE